MVFLIVAQHPYAGAVVEIIRRRVKEPMDVVGHDYVGQGRCVKFTGIEGNIGVGDLGIGSVGEQVFSLVGNCGQEIGETWFIVMG